MKYHDIDAINASILKRVLVSPKHAKHYIDHGLKPTASLLLGSMLDDAVFDPEKFNSIYAAPPPGMDMRTKIGKGWKADQLERGTVVVTADQMAQTLSMLNALRDHPIASDMLFSEMYERETQLELQWTDVRTSAKCKGKPDLIAKIKGEIWLLDLKTSANPYPRQFSGEMAKFGYDVQLAFYRDGIESRGGKVDRVGLIVVGKGAVNDVIVYEIDENHVLFHGRQKYQDAIDTYLTCTRENSWPGFAERAVVPLRLPEYAYSDDVELTMDGEGVTA